MYSKGKRGFWEVHLRLAIRQSILGDIRCLAPARLMYAENKTQIANFWNLANFIVDFNVVYFN